MSNDLTKDPTAVMLYRLEKHAKAEAEKAAKKADYKIQLWFKSDRKLHGDDIAYTLSFWESGKRMHGGGDEMMFICRRHSHAPKLRPFEVIGPKTKATERGCDGLIPGGIAVAGGIVCPHCQSKHQTEQIGDSIFYRTSMAKCAKVLADWWHKLGDNADIYVKYCPTDPRTILMSRTMTPTKARELKGLTIYPLDRIIKDITAGAAVESRFKALITA